MLHLDMDSFFASVEEKLNPRLKGKPILVGGTERRGVVASANYAARPFGIHAGMPMAEAKRLCPHAVFVEGNPQKYVHTSLQFLDVLKSFTPAVEPFSIDEAFLDLTQVPYPGRPSPEERDPAVILDSAIPVAHAIQRAVQRRVGLTATIGIAPNKYIAKMASGVQKPRGLTVLTLERYRERFWERGVQELWGIGEKTKEALAKLGIRTIGQLAKFPREFLTYHFGLNGERMQEAALGRDENPVIPYYEGVPVKSMGHEITLSEDVSDKEALKAQLLRLSDMVGRRLRADGYLGRIISVKIRDSKFRTTIRQRALPEVVDDEHEIFHTAALLLEEHWDGRPLRLIGVSVSGLVSAAGHYQHSLFGQDEHRRKLLEAVDSLRDRFGEHSLVKAGVLR
ncbi:MAG: DNA polymerase IV [Candidatus Eisenbacteria bacterium]|uniref:DNA polymerase IV n=1 Tax=Eiseniibacteriota bacterium TaxID=2212470 RepID=A0A538SPY0_UNCEI|nr:MAG: DNA polymerase IV [Candidatus Eisenbacteria bacterium]